MIVCEVFNIKDKIIEENQWFTEIDLLLNIFSGHPFDASIYFFADVWRLDMTHSVAILRTISEFEASDKEAEDDETKKAEDLSLITPQSIIKVVGHSRGNSCICE